MLVVERALKTLSLKDYERRTPELVAQLLSIAEFDGCFALTDHGIAEEDIKAMFVMSEKFFSLLSQVKEKYPFERTKVLPSYKIAQQKNAGWESNSQLRPSTGTYDMKESLPLQYAAATSDGKWPTDQDCPGFEEITKRFMAKCRAVSCVVMRLFAIGLGLNHEEWFVEVHDIENRGNMSTLRYIHYHDMHGKQHLQVTGVQGMFVNTSMIR